MIRFLVYFLLAAVAFSMIAADPTEGPNALLMVVCLVGVSLVVIRRYVEEKDFITIVFLAALCVRLLFGIIVHSFGLREFAGSDALGYDTNASRIVDYWISGIGQGDPELARIMSIRGSGWGMQYLVSFIYLISNKSILVAQSFCAVIGAATVPLTYFCSESMFHNKRVARTTALAVAFFPAFIIWSSQLLKDGMMVFLIVLTLTLVIQLQRQFSWLGILVICFSLFGILSLRFYIFYVMAVAVIGSFVVGLSTSLKSIVQRLAILIVVAAALSYLGVIETTTTDLRTYGSLERTQVSRADLARSAESGFGRDVDISTYGGALSAIPLGFIYLMFAPFPWEVTNFRQSITLPDVLMWWAMIPLLIYGLWYTLKNRLRACFPILIFTLMLTVSYSIFQGNIGTAYRQRTQIQVFLFMFIAVGWGLIKEKIEDKKASELTRKNELNRQLRARFQERQKAI